LSSGDSQDFAGIFIFLQRSSAVAEHYVLMDMAQ
jgi:hypothetical protein